jgi:hypothetical protein
VDESLPTLERTVAPVSPVSDLPSTICLDLRAPSRTLDLGRSGVSMRAKPLIAFVIAGAAAVFATVIPAVTLTHEEASGLAFRICFVIVPFDAAQLNDALDRTIADFAFPQVRSVKRQLDGCVKALERLLRHRRPPASSAAAARRAAAPCAVAALPVTRRSLGRSRRVRPRIGSPRRARSRLAVGCARADDGTATITVRPRKRSVRLRALTGPRLELGVGRPRTGPPAQAGDRLTVRWGSPAR